MSDIGQRLKTETADLHRDLEGVVDIMRDDVSRADYVAFLTGLLGFYRPIERQLRAREDLVDFLPDLDRRWKVELLERDLRALAATPPESLVCDDVPQLTGPGPGRALGTLYVMEGSTLGGQIIHRHLAEHLPEVLPATAFLTCYGKELGPMWKRFGAGLASAAERVGDEDSMVAAARETFAKLRTWMVSAGS